ncbi:MAG: amino acid adenylation domain-containing protein [Magnetococcales bacterium]|nr:amino acid adenylation domain-containing protein [Magnetococcales bacterium]
MPVSRYYYSLGQYFDEVSLVSSERPALCYSSGIYSYRVFLNLVERLSAMLINRGCRRGDVIAIGHNKYPLSYALMMAALRLGVSYTNLDVFSPVERTSHIIQICRPILLCYDDPRYTDAMAALASIGNCPLVLLTEDLLPEVSDAQRGQQKGMIKLVDSACIAYIMFTSGSTGIPKGVAVTHQNVLHFIEWGQSYFGITNQDNFAQLSPMYFDNSVFDFYLALFSGASLSPIYRELLTKPYDLVSHVNRIACTVWFSVPSLLIYLTTMKTMTSVALPSLRIIVFGGEGYPKVELRKLFEQFSTQATLTNVYGPTECTCICSAHTLRNEDFLDMDGLPTLGRLNPNFDYLILNDEGINDTNGELCLIGPNVAAGYYNNIDLTSKYFITLTESDRFMKRMYRTGDLVREVNGNLHFIGRRDNQVKHMGYRIELEDIENALVKLPKVNQAIVLYYKMNSSYGKLIGFISSAEHLDEKDLIMDLARSLPSYMIPSRLIVVPQLPINPNGKVDRNQLRDLVEIS